MTRINRPADLRDAIVASGADLTEPGMWAVTLTREQEVVSVEAVAREGTAEDFSRDIERVFGAARAGHHILCFAHNHNFHGTAPRPEASCFGMAEGLCALGLTANVPVFELLVLSTTGEFFSFNAAGLLLAISVIAGIKLHNGEYDNLEEADGEEWKSGTEAPKAEQKPGGSAHFRSLTPAQRESVNQARARSGLPPLEAG